MSKINAAKDMKVVTSGIIINILNAFYYDFMRTASAKLEVGTILCSILSL
jgi:hypothetical protein